MVERLGYLSAYRALARHAAATHAGLLATNDLTVLDVGTGSGALALALGEALGNRVRLDLVDPSAPMLSAAERLLATGGLRARLIHGTAEDVVAPPGGYAVVAFAHVIEHLPDPVGALVSMRRLLRPGGLMIAVISKPHWCSRLVWLRWRHRSFPQYEALACLDQAGLHEVGVFPFAAGPPSRTSLGYLARNGP